MLMEREYWRPEPAILVLLVCMGFLVGVECSPFKRQAPRCAPSFKPEEARDQLDVRGSVDSLLSEVRQNREAAFLARAKKKGEATDDSPKAIANPEDDPLYDPFDEEPEEETPRARVRDPLRKFNRAMFVFNDKLYFWALKPVSKGYRKVVPQRARVSVRKFFTNAESPVRIVSCLLQGKFKASGTECLRFLANTTYGCLGFRDVATDKFGMKFHDEDCGQILGRYGVRPGPFIMWPVFGPSNIRDTVGMVGDTPLRPWFYIGSLPIRVGIRAYRRANTTSLQFKRSAAGEEITDYEGIKDAALDPYVSIRDMFMQRRGSKVKDEIP